MICNLCGEPIRAGELYNRGNGVQHAGRDYCIRYLRERAAREPAPPPRRISASDILEQFRRPGETIDDVRERWHERDAFVGRWNRQGPWTWVQEYIDAQREEL